MSGKETGEGNEQTLNLNLKANNAAGRRFGQSQA